MRAQEFIRELLNMLDNVEQDKVKTGIDNHMASVEELVKPCGHSDPCDCHAEEYQNEPNESYANIHAVSTSAGGGVNGPKHPADIRGNSVNIYPREKNG